MNSEQQYMDIFTGCREMLDSHSVGAMNALRDKAFEDFTRQGFPTQKVERYKYTDVPAAFAPDYGLNLNRVEFPVNPYEAFRCDVPNLSTCVFICGERRFLPEVAAGRYVARRRGGMLPEAGGRGLSRPGVGLLRQIGPYGERRD